ncbi:hypothetical protein EDB89DRAFT_2187715 [Lactarius sanguifluus]|nr:hypothetical protein EDB89DRAFT_2187715 [Lactarius sanguifluus]
MTWPGGCCAEHRALLYTMKACFDSPTAVFFTQAYFRVGETRRGQLTRERLSREHATYALKNRSGIRSPGHARSIFARLFLCRRDSSVAGLTTVPCFARREAKSVVWGAVMTHAVSRATPARTTDCGWGLAGPVGPRRKQSLGWFPALLTVVRGCGNSWSVLFAIHPYTSVGTTSGLGSEHRCERDTSVGWTMKIEAIACIGDDLISASVCVCCHDLPEHADLSGAIISPRECVMRDRHLANVYLAVGP